MLDVVTLGETHVRFSPKGCQRLDQAHEMEVNAAGAESNVAVAAARTSRAIRPVSARRRGLSAGVIPVTRTTRAEVR